MCQAITPVKFVKIVTKILFYRILIAMPPHSALIKSFYQVNHTITCLGTLVGIKVAVLGMIILIFICAFLLLFILLLLIILLTAGRLIQHSFQKPSTVYLSTRIKIFILKYITECKYKSLFLTICVFFLSSISHILKLNLRLHTGLFHMEFQIVHMDILIVIHVPCTYTSNT